MTLSSVTLFFTGCSGASVMDSNVQNKQARVILLLPPQTDQEKLKEALRHAISYRVDDIIVNENLFPEELPLQPQKPGVNKVYKKLMSFAGSNINAKMRYQALDMSNAWYSVYGVGGMTSEYLNKAEYYKAGIYPYKDGYKIYIYEFYTEGTDGILGNLTNAAVGAIVGNDGALLYMAQVRDDFLNRFPEAKILQQSPKKLEKLELNAVGWEK